MVKVRGPAMSLGASGSLGGALVFATWKGRPYVRILVTPANPKSVSQVGMRAMFKFVSQEWASIAAGDQSDWEDLADATNISPFNAYVKENQANWRDFLSPSQVFPITRTGTPSGETAPAATTSGRNIIINDTTTAGADQWGIVIFRGLAPAFTPNWSNAIAVIPVAASTAWTYTDGPLDPDTYYYQMIHTATDGNDGSPGTEVNATVV